MGESTKAVSTLVMIFGSIVSACAWAIDRPDWLTWICRLGGAIAVALSLGLILLLHFRKDIVPDFLSNRFRNWFNRSGFCFAIDITAEMGIAYMEVYFQNQFERSASVLLAVRPALNFWMRRAPFCPVQFSIDCPPCGYGVSRLAIPVPAKLQGRRQSFEVGATVHFPDGKGRRLRFRDGEFLRANAEFREPLGRLIAWAGVFAGQSALLKRPSASLDIPVGVATELNGPAPTETVILWDLEDGRKDGMI